MPVPHLFVTRAPAKKDFSSDVQCREVDHSPLELLHEAAQFLDLTNVAIDSIDESVQFLLEILGGQLKDGHLLAGRVLLETFQFCPFLNDAIPNSDDVFHHILNQWQHLVGLIDGDQSALILGVTDGSHVGSPN